MLRTLGQYGPTHSRKKRRSSQGQHRTKSPPVLKLLSNFDRKEGILDSFPTPPVLLASTASLEQDRTKENRPTFRDGKDNDLRIETSLRTASEMPHVVPTLSNSRQPSISDDGLREVDGDALSLHSTREKRIHDLLRRASYSSSMVSEIRSVIGIRFSLSSFATSSRCSISLGSMADRDDSQSVVQHKSTIGSSPGVVLESHRRMIERSNTDLIELCCSNTHYCIHRWIRDQTTRMQDLSICWMHLPPGELQNADDVSYQTNSPDSRGNTELFFAARSGAPPMILIYLIERTGNINAVNDSGQTFLFLLDPQHSCFLYCNCFEQPSLHSSGFECLIRWLEKRSFNFDQIDHDGRHFLSYLCALPSFNAEWLFRIMEKDQKWTERVLSLSRIRDSSGTFLRDFLALNSRAEVPHDYKLELGPAITVEMTSVGILLAEEEQEWAALEDVVQLEGSKCRASFQYLADRAFESDIGFVWNVIKSYNRLGRTYLMDFLEMVCREEFREKWIISKAKKLVSLGANVNARARDGSTVLHIVAKYPYPELLEYLFSVGIQVGHSDNAGHTALDYAGKTFLRSRSSNAQAIRTARSFKTATRLFEYATFGTIKFSHEKS